MGLVAHFFVDLVGNYGHFLPDAHFNNLSFVLGRPHRSQRVGWIIHQNKFSPVIYKLFHLRNVSLPIIVSLKVI
jgi:hypothetical protein